MLYTVSIIAVVILAITSTFLLFSTRWRWSLIALAVQYMAVFWLVGLVWSVPMATVKLVVGWMVTAVIGASQPGQGFTQEKFPGIPGVLIRLLSVGMVIMLVFSLSPAVARIFQTGLVLVWGGLILAVVGLLQLGLGTHVSRVMLGLFTLLAGFEILYASVETSVLVAGLLAVLNLGLALVGAYLLEAPTMEVNQ